MNTMLVKLATHFPKDSQRIAVIETNRLQNWHWQGPDGLVPALFIEQPHYKQATSTRSIHRYLCRRTKFSLRSYLWKQLGIAYSMRKFTFWSRSPSFSMWNNYCDNFALYCGVNLISSSTVLFFSLNTACLLPRARGRFKCPPQTTAVHTWFAKFSLASLVIWLRVRWLLE